jgi:hypothetical protein
MKLNFGVDQHIQSCDEPLSFLSMTKEFNVILNIEVAETITTVRALVCHVKLYFVKRRNNGLLLRKKKLTTR